MNVEAAPWVVRSELSSALRRNDFDRLRKVYPSSRFVWDKRRCRVYLFWGYRRTSLPGLLEQKIDVIVLLPTMEVWKDYYGKGVPDNLVPPDLDILAVMET